MTTVHESTTSSFLTAAGEVLSGIATGSTHGYWYAKNLGNAWLVKPFQRLAGLSTNDANNAAESSIKELQVVGVGYGRTGTYSLTLALDELGYKTLHTQHMYETPEILDMWNREIFTPSIESENAVLGHPDFDLIASKGFTATADLPMSLYFEQLVDRYPNCKFILTTRQSSEVWFRSWDMLTKTITTPTRYFSWMSHADTINRYYRWLFSRINEDNSYLSVPLPLPDQNKERSIASYEEHNRRVREVIPVDRLLEYNVKQGYEPLCQFLEIADCPTSPFPKTNSARSVQVQTISAMVIPLALVLFVLFYAFANTFHRQTGQTIVQWTNSKWTALMEKQSNRAMENNEETRRKRKNKNGGGKEKKKQQ
mmetsp:Transcript_2346/g.3954  ORF Transcript_2346/g.3954 Transcript_2346/m.3954 type:complete len:368 (-) Transcript_2346:151-1254(-)|eukprot:CAMPEP_0197715044 /NCGR_PEP_ID=MMETSP1434-20131217/193_1 /TAXON_ID=265543 /ORGANISM="Minutocellus polymorphus, Strain CCMP3303" /LENGTH=367 /DNA_ID=CAMNT_0043299031 /DNA_START=104 /DNA_END=1207 /DNA_ORIENTATION=-